MQIFYSLYFKAEDFARLAVCGGKAKKFLSSHFIIGAKFISKIFQRTLPKKKTAKHIGDTRIQMPQLIRMPPLIQV